MSESYSLPTEPEGVAASLLERFNSGKVSAMMIGYEPGAVFIARDGRTVTDHTEIAAELERDLKYGLPLKAKTRHVFVAGDIAQIVLDWSLDWSIDGTGPDGEHQGSLRCSRESWAIRGCSTRPRGRDRSLTSRSPRTIPSQMNSENRLLAE